MTSSFRVLVVAALVVAVASCSVPPKPDLPALRNEAPLAGLPVPSGGRWPDAQWWKRYQDPQLDALEEQALAHAPGLEEAQRRFGSALQSIEVARATGGLSAQGSAQAQRLRLSEHGLIPSNLLGLTWYSQGDLGLQFQYDFDFWGKQRAAVAAAVDQARAAKAERSAAALMLTSAVADTYFAWQADQARMSLADANLAALEQRRVLGMKRIAQGIDAADLLHNDDGQIAAARELRAVYAGSAPIRLAALAALLGVAPADLPTLAAKELPAVDTRLPDQVGLDLLARRPDIAARRWQVEAAMQQVHQVRAEFYPDISLGAIVGLSSIDLGKLLNPGSAVVAFGPALHLPLFNLDRLHAAYGVSQAQLQAAAAQYDAAVVSAAQDVATQALTLSQIAERRAHRRAQLDAARGALDSSQARERRGLIDARAVLSAKAQVIQQRDAAVTLHAQALSSEIALTKALGGGFRWQPGADGDPSTTASPDPAHPAPHKPTSDLR